MASPAARQIRSALPDTAVVILTTFGEDEYIARALDYGAAGFLLKGLDPRELVAGVHAVANGAACLSPIIAQRVITELRKDLPIAADLPARARVSAFPRERDVLALLGAGLSNADIAKRLYLVEGTVQELRQRDPDSPGNPQPGTSGGHRRRSRPRQRRSAKPVTRPPC